MTNASEFRAPDWESYKMVYKEPHREIEPPADEIAIVGQTLNALVAAGILSSAEYDLALFDAFRQGVRDTFEIPWTAITPRLQRTIYAINAIVAPKVMVAAGVFCGNTFISNAGAAVGTGAAYAAEDLVGLEILPEEAARAERNIRAFDPTGTARILAADAVQFVADYDRPIDLLYLDASAPGEKGKRIYLEILEAAYDKLSESAVVLAHNSVNNAERLAEYLGAVRDPSRFAASLNVVIDGEGLEVSRL
jgi:predicted O-methyltransferase YrrM